MKKLFFVALIAIPTAAIATEPSILEIEKSIQFHQGEAARLESQAQEILDTTAANQANKFLDTKFPDSSAAPRQVSRHTATAKREAQTMRAQATEHRQLATNLQGEAETIRARMKNAK
jgi:hypothetical protein